MGSSANTREVVGYTVAHPRVEFIQAFYVLSPLLLVTGSFCGNDTIASLSWKLV